MLEVIIRKFILEIPFEPSQSLSGLKRPEIQQTKLFFHVGKKIYMQEYF